MQNAVRQPAVTTGVRMRYGLPTNYRKFVLPWTKSEEERQRLRRLFRGIAGTLIAISLVMPFLPSRKVSLNDAPPVPPRLAKLIIERKQPPPPPPPVEQVEPEPETPVVEPEPVPEPEPVVEPPPEPKVELIVPEPIVEPPPERQAAREKAQQTGLLAVADQLADLRDFNLDNAQSDQQLSAGVGASDRSERSLITSSTGRASGGINTAAMSRDVGGGALAGRTVTEVTSPIVTAEDAAVAGGDPSAPSNQAARSRADIERVFDQNKSAIYALYRRALRSDPTLQGKLVLELTIAADGSVTDCRVVSSELNAPDFESRLVKRVKLFNFGAQDVGVVTTTKPIDFFPI